jgi:hypothetical protein
MASQSTLLGRHQQFLDGAQPAELYSHLHEDLLVRLNEAERVGYGFALPVFENVSVVPMIPKSQETAVEVAG